MASSGPSIGKLSIKDNRSFNRLSIIFILCIFVEKGIYTLCSVENEPFREKTCLGVSDQV